MGEMGSRMVMDYWLAQTLVASPNQAFAQTIPAQFAINIKFCLFKFLHWFLLLQRLRNGFTLLFVRLRMRWPLVSCNSLVKLD